MIVCTFDIDGGLRGCASREWCVPLAMRIDLVRGVATVSSSYLDPEQMASMLASLRRALRSKFDANAVLAALACAARHLLGQHLFFERLRVETQLVLSVSDRVRVVEMRLIAIPRDGHGCGE